MCLVFGTSEHPLSTRVAAISQHGQQGHAEGSLSAKEGFKVLIVIRFILILSLLKERHPFFFLLFLFLFFIFSFCSINF